MARTILDEVLGFRPDFIEHRLAHAVRDPNGRAHNRTSHLPERRRMIQRWAGYLDKLERGRTSFRFGVHEGQAQTGAAPNPLYQCAIAFGVRVGPTFSYGHGHRRTATAVGARHSELPYAVSAQYAQLRIWTVSLRIGWRALIDAWPLVSARARLVRF